ncbi:MAG: lytic transglycosylase domain-containing protein [Steroidobacteraceae bacterium]
MRSRAPLPMLCACATLLAMQAAHAAIYAFTDERGIVHYSNVPSDARYQMVIAGPVGETTARHFIEVALDKSQQYSGLIEVAATASRLEPALVRAVMVAESGADPQAVSKRGARGLMQLMPETARQYGVRNLLDPAENIRAGSQYLRYLTDRYRNDLHLVLAAYNAGPAAVDQSGGRIPPLKETLDYVPRVLEIYSHLQELARAR